MFTSLASCHLSATSYFMESAVTNHIAVSNNISYMGWCAASESFKNYYT